MLRLASEMDQHTRITCLIAGWVAIDENAGPPPTWTENPIRLRRSNGRRMAGRPTKYYLHGLGGEYAVEIRAYTDAEAVEKANNYLEEHKP